MTINSAILRDDPNDSELDVEHEVSESDEIVVGDVGRLADAPTATATARASVVEIELPSPIKRWKICVVLSVVRRDKWNGAQ